jgi:hypothetical protein
MLLCNRIDVAGGEKFLAQRKIILVPGIEISAKFLVVRFDAGIQERSSPVP